MIHSIGPSTVAARASSRPALCGRPRQASWSIIEGTVHVKRPCRLTYGERRVFLWDLPGGCLSALHTLLHFTQQLYGHYVPLASLVCKSAPLACTAGQKPMIASRAWWTSVPRSLFRQVLPAVAMTLAKLGSSLLISRVLISRGCLTLSVILCQAAAADAACGHDIGISPNLTNGDA